MNSQEINKMVEIDLGEGTEPTTQEDLKNVKKEVIEDSVEPNPRFLLLLVGALIFVGGMLGGFALINSSSEPISDLNALTEQHTTLALLELTDANVLFNELQIIKSGLVNLQVQHICGVNDLVLDSNMLIENEQGSFVTYQCYAKVGDTT